jgi:gliding motility-associated-like protein
MKKLYFYLLLALVSQQVFSQNYTVLGNASSLGGCNCYRLTPDANDQAGAIFQNQTINLNNSFDFSFNAFLGCNNGNDAADGIVFVLTSNPNGLGAGGGGLGYGGGNQPYSLGVEFDTYQNSGDPSYDHIGIESGGSVLHNIAAAVPALPGSGNIDNCQQYLVRIVWDVNTNTYSVYFNGVLRISVVIPNMVNTYFGGNPIVNWGWSAGTGGGTNDQQICVLNTSSWIAGINYQSCSPTMQFNDISTSSLGSVQSWAWNFGDGGTSTLQNPSHTYTGNGTYNVSLTIVDISGCSNTYTHTITINPPISLSPTITPPLCNGGSNGNISVVSSGGFGPSAGYGGYAYTWSNSTTQSNLLGAGAGTYTLTVTDGVCTSTAQYTISQPTAVTATTSHTDAPCGGNGTATLTVSGGTPPYSGVNWAGFPATSGVPLSMPAGTWIADFQDANSCSALLQYRETISSLPCGITTSLTSTNVSCFSGSNGTATLTVTGGSGGSVAGWTSAGNIFTITGLASGTYNYNYTDANPALNFSFTVTITQPGAAIVAAIATNDMSCANTNDGQAIASVNSGGTTPFNYTWSGGQPNNPVATNLSPGAISVIITDANGCTANAAGTITGPPTLTLNVTSINDSCYQANLGSATANAGGGNPPYTYYWNNISSAQTNLSLGAGVYTVTVTDDKGCTITGSATINQPAAFTHTPLVPTNILCFGGTTGAISTSASGGTPAYNYTWSPAGSGNNPTGLSAGQYNVTIADANNCVILDSVVLTQPASALTVTTSHTNVSCNGGNDGTLTITISGGTAPYSFLGNPAPAGTTVIPGRTANTYAGNVLDANNCSVAVSEVITEPALLTVTETHVDVLCNGANTGSIDLTTAGGTTPYTYNWGGGITTEDRNAIPAGSYSVTVTDFELCTATLTVTLTQPTALAIAETHVNVLCNGVSTGSIDVTVTGGVTAYTYAWNGGVATEDRTAIPAGVYQVTATDQNSCSVSTSVTITEPAAFVVTTSHTNVSCNGGSDGTLTINISGGTAPYSFLGNPVPAGTTVIPGRTANTHAGNVLDANNCAVSVSEVITEPAVLSLSEQHVNATCFGGTQGSIDITVTGGTSPYTYVWNDGVTTEDRTGITAGTYLPTCTDQNGCSATISVTITEPAAPVMLVAVTNATCFGANGSATANPSGGNAPFSYVWSGLGSTIGQTVTKPAGNYTVTATDASTCQQTASLTITQPADITIAETHTNLRCFGDANGDVTLMPTGGAGNYTYVWNPNVSNTNAATLLTAGTYDATVTDQNTCTKTISVTLTQPTTPLTINIQSNNISCFGANDGSITITASGGTSPYTYTWNPNVTATNSVSNLGPGNYAITIADANNCSVNPNVSLSEPSQPLNVVPSQTNLTCFESNDGTASVITNGGTAPYSFAWSPNVSSSFSATALAANNYDLTVTDNNGCTITNTFAITQPTPITTGETHVNVLCNGNTTGSVTITANGGTPGYTYTWSPNVSAIDVAMNVGAGTYNVTVADANACTVLQTATVTEPPLLTLSATSIPALCFGTATGIVTSFANGGVPAYNFAASDGGSTLNSSTGVFNNLATGNYSVTVTDQNTCTTTTTVFVSEPTSLVNVIAVAPATCYHSLDGSIAITTTGGTPGYNYLLETGAANSTGNFTGLGATTYTFTVTDASGCSLTDSGTITEPDSVLIDVSPTPVEVKLGNSLQLSTTTNQGGNVTYDWSPQFGLSCYDCSNPLFEGIYSQPYLVVATNQDGCVGTSKFVVTVIPNYDIFIPNAFTPINGDGVNDYWQIFGNMPAIKQVEVMVFNRIGEKVFESTDINFKWDGTYMGVAAPPGVYSYVAKFVWLNNHSDARYKGTITLLR